MEYNQKTADNIHDYIQKQITFDISFYSMYFMSHILVVFNRKTKQEKTFSFSDTSNTGKIDTSRSICYFIVESERKNKEIERTLMAEP